MPTVARRIEISIPPAGEYINLNKTKHHASPQPNAPSGAKPRTTPASHTRARWHPGLGFTSVTARIPVIGNRTRDPHNWSPTLKPIVDGFEDAGIWPDDGAEFVTVAEPVLIVVTKPTDVVVILEELER